MKKVINVYLMITLSIWSLVPENYIRAETTEYLYSQNKLNYSFYFEALIGKRVYIKKHDAKKYEGKLLAVDDDRLIISNKKEESIAIKINEIASFKCKCETKEGRLANHVKIAAIIGIVCAYLIPRILFGLHPIS